MNPDIRVSMTAPEPIVYTCQNCQKSYKSKSGLTYHQKKLPCALAIDPSIRAELAPYMR